MGSSLFSLLLSRFVSFPSAWKTSGHFSIQGSADEGKVDGERGTPVLLPRASPLIQRTATCTVRVDDNRYHGESRSFPHQLRPHDLTIAPPTAVRR